MTTFKRATRQQAKLKLAITGPSGSGKTYSALLLAQGLTKGGKVVVIDTENKSASLYSDRFLPFEFDTLDMMPPFSEDKFVKAIDSAVEQGYDAIIIDSASHFWEAVMEWKDNLDKKGGNSFTNWRQANSKFKDVLTAVLHSDIHVICCMRSKMDYVLEEQTNDRGQSKKVPKKLGMAPIMRPEIEYEFTTVFDVDIDHHATTSKDRTGIFGDNSFMIGEETGEALLKWLAGGAPEKDMLAELVKGLEVQAVEFLESVGWLKPGGLLKELSAEHRRVILSKPDDFVKKLREPKKEKQPAKEEATTEPVPTA